jgi:hypothetical protein
MSKKKAVSPPAGSSGIVSPDPTPHRPVVSLALVLFVPALWLVLQGNLSVQTALVRFIGALLVSWVAARLVLATVRTCTRAATTAGATAAAAAKATATAAAGATGGATGAALQSGGAPVPTVNPAS